MKIGRSASTPPGSSWTVYYHRPAASGRFTVYAPNYLAAEAAAVSKLEPGDVLDRIEGGRP